MTQDVLGTTSATAAARTAPPPHSDALVAFAKREWPYLVMIVLSMAGVAYTTLFPQTSHPFWEILAPIFGLICIATQWSKVYPQGKHWRLITTQVLHWGMFALSMQLLFLPDVQRTMESFAISLVVLYLLAMSTFLVGIYYASWRLCVVGLFLGAAIPVISLFQEAALLLVIVGLVLIAGLYLYFRYRGGREEDEEAW